MKPSEFMKKMQAANKSADEHGATFENLPDGLYLVAVQSAKRNVSKGSGRNQVSFDSKVIEPADFKDKHHWWHQNLDHEVGLAILVQQFRIMEYDTTSIGSFEDIDEICNDVNASEVVLKIQLRTKKEYQNTSVLEYLGKKETKQAEPKKEVPVPEEPVATTPEDEEVPLPEEPADTTPEDEEEEEGEEEVSIDVGDTVTFTFKKAEKKGVIEALHDDEQKVTVKTADGKKFKISIENILTVE